MRKLKLARSVVKPNIDHRNPQGSFKIQAAAFLKKLDNWSYVAASNDFFNKRHSMKVLKSSRSVPFQNIEEDEYRTVTKKKGLTRGSSQRILNAVSSFKLPAIEKFSTPKAKVESPVSIKSG